MKKTITVLLALISMAASLFAAAPPDRMNFQGVLRNASNAPQNGTFDMVFQFYDAATLGNQILVDTHTGGSAVTVTGGMFNVQLGSGVVTDGTGPGTYTTLTNMFRDFSSVFVEVHVASDTLAPRIEIASSGFALNAEHADLLDGLDSTAFATTSHVHQTLTAGAGLGGISYDGGAAKTFSVNYGTAANTAVQGNQTATVSAGSGLTGGVSADTLGDGFSATVNVGAGNGISVAADSVALGDLSADWTQNAPFSINLNNASSQLRMLDSSGTFFGILDVDPLVAPATYRFSGLGGTVWTSGNDGAASTLDADLLDGLNSTAFATSSHTHQNLTAGSGLTGTTYNGGSASTFNVGAGNGISVATDTVLLGPLTSDWNQTGAFDINLNNASSELNILESTGATFFGTLDIGDLAANQTYTFAGAGGTVWTSGNDGVASTLDADLLDGQDSAAFATASHTHQNLTAGSGLTGTTYNGGAASTFDVGAGNGITVATDTVLLGPLTADWNQTGAFDIVLSNSASELKILENGASPTSFGIFDVADLTINRTYTFPDASGTVWTSGNDGGGSGLDADSLDGFSSFDFAPIVHSHPTLTAGAGLGGVSYDGLFAKTFSVNYGATASTAVEGNQTATINAGNGLTGGVSADALGDGFSSTVDVGAGSGISVAADTVLLGPLTADWNQTGAFDISLNNSTSELKMLESGASPTLFGIFDVGDLTGSNSTFTFSGPSGTVWTTGNDGAASTLDADLLDGVDSGSFLRSDASDNYTAGTLTFNTGTTLGVNGTFKVGPASSTDSDFIFFDDGSSEFLVWDDAFTEFQLTDDLYISQGLGVDGAIQAGVVDFPVGPAFNSFRSNTAEAPRGGLMNDPGDLYIENDLEVGDVLQFSDSYFDIPVGNISGFGGSLQIRTQSDSDIFLSSTGTAVEFIVDSDNDQGTSPIGFQWFSNGANRTMKLSDDTGNLSIDGAYFAGGADLAENYRMGEPLQAGDLVRISPNGAKEILLTQGAEDISVLGVVSAKPGIVLGGGDTFNEAELRKAWGDPLANQYMANREQLRAEVLAKSSELQARKTQLNSLPSVSSSTNEGKKNQIQQQRGEMAAQFESELDGAAMIAFFEHNMAPIALSGRTPVKVDTQFGEIKIGDELGPSPIPGVAMKLTSAGPTIGTAMENFSGGRGMVMVFVHRGWYSPAASPAIQTAGATKNEIMATQSNSEMTKQSQSGGASMKVDVQAGEDLAFFIPKDSKDPGEVFRVNEPMEAGDVLAADRTLPGVMRKANTAHDPAVVGIVSARVDGVTESVMNEMWKEGSRFVIQFESARSSGDRVEAAHALEQIQLQFNRTHAMIAPAGRVTLCKVDAGYGGIEVGNLLVASPTPGHAMRSDNPLPGTVIGKALEPLAAGTGLIRVLVMMR